MSILLSENGTKNNSLLDYAEKLLQWFVGKAHSLYGITFNVYNVHSLLHIVDDARTYRCSLDKICAFKYENHMQIFKKRIKNSMNPAVQFLKREAERKKHLEVQKKLPDKRIN